jgi:phosphate-selective porin OprO and OprP
MENDPTMKTIPVALLIAVLSIPLSAETSSDANQDVGDAAKEAPKLTAKLGGRLQLDYAWYDDHRDDGGELRRGRLEVKGGLGDDWEYKVQFEFSGDSPELRDGLLRYKGLGPGSLAIGNYKQPSSMEALASSNNTTFLETGLVTALAEGRRMGVAYEMRGAHYTAMVSIFGDEPNGAVHGSGIIGRGVLLPVNTPDRVVHLGGSVSRGELDDGVLRVRIRPASHVTDARILDTGSIPDVDGVSRFGLEGAVMLDRFSAQAEYIRSDVSRDGGAPDLTFDGWYAYASWFLTRDRRSYDAREGFFGKVTPRESGGAWEVALRYETIDLTSREIRAGSASAWTAALNWYPNAFLRFMANYSRVDSDALAGNDDPNVFQVRMQIAF